MFVTCPCLALEILVEMKSVVRILHYKYTPVFKFLNAKRNLFNYLAIALLTKP